MMKTATYTFIGLSLLWLTVCPQPAAAKPNLEQGIADLEALRFSRAVETFSSIIDEDPNNYRAYTGRGTALFYRKQYDRAIADFNSALGINPTHADAFLGRGMARYYIGQYRRALSDYQEALKSDPHNPRIMNQLAWTLAVCPSKRIRDGKKALDLAKRATTLDNGFHYLDTLAAAYAEAGDFRSAVKTQKQVVATLIESNRESDVDIYLERLRAYKKNKPWRDNTVGTLAEKADTKEIAEKETKETVREEAKKTAKADIVKAAKQELEESEKAVAKAPVQKSATEPAAAQEAPQPEAESVAPAEQKPAVAGSEPAEKATAESSAVAASGRAAEPSPEAETKQPDGALREAALEEARKSEKAIVSSAQPGVAPEYDSTHPFTIQVSSYRDRDKALTVATNLRKKGDPAFFSQAAIGGAGGETTLWYRVFLGVYDSRESANAAAAQLLKRRFRHPEVKFKPYSIQIGLFNDETDLDKAIDDLQADGYLSYRIAHGENQTRLLIGAYRTPDVPPTLINALKEKGYYPIVVRR